MWQTTCGVAMRSVMNENGGGGSSPGCTSSPAQSIVRPSSRGGVPVFSRPSAKPWRASVCDRPSDGRFADPARRDLFFADMDQAVEKGAGRQHDPAGRNPPAVAEHEPADLPAGIEQQILGRPLDDVETRRFGQQFGDGAAIELAVGLRARPAHRRALAAVQDAELDPGAVDRPAHDAVERIDLAHQMPLAEPADRRVARHLADRRPLVRQQQRARPDPRRRRRRLAPGMPAADHDNVVMVLHVGEIVWIGPRHVD